MLKFFKSISEWIGHFEAVKFILHLEFVRTLLFPTIVTAMTAWSGVIGGIPVMWILVAAALVFAATVQGLLRSSEFIERKNPNGKLKFIQSCVAMDLVQIPELNRQQRRAGYQTPPNRHIDKMQLGATLQNTATFPLSVIVEYAESEIEGVTPPRTQYPKPSVIIPPGLIIYCRDERMSMNNMPCHNVVGKYDIRVKYGLPGKERFEFRQASSLEIQIHAYGLVTNINDSLAPASISLLLGGWTSINFKEVRAICVAIGERP